MVEIVEDEASANWLRTLTNAGSFAAEASEDQKGGPGSGDYGHAGRPGQVGGSGPSLSGHDVDWMQPGNVVADGVSYRRFPHGPEGYAPDVREFLERFDYDRYDAPSWDDSYDGLRAYFGPNGFRNIQDFLRGIRPAEVVNQRGQDVERLVKQIDSQLTGELPENVVGYRMMQVPRTVKVGDEFVDHGYSSVALAEATTFAFHGDKAMLLMPEGTKGIANANEDEWLLPRDSQFKVLKTPDKPGDMYVLKVK